MFLRSQELKISDNFGEEFLEKIFKRIEEEFHAKFIKTSEVEPELVFYDYLINEEHISFLSEGFVGTSIIGNRKIIEQVFEFLKSDQLI